MSQTAALMPTSVEATGLFSKGDLRAIRGQLYLAIVAFGIGILAGLAQALDRILPADSALWQLFPYQKNYYQGLTMHGVVLAIVLTFAFSNAFMTLVHQKSLDRRPVGWLVQGSFWLMLVGVVLAIVEITLNHASVLFTMYPPLMASPIYYVGLVLIVVSTWLTAANVWLSFRAWRKQHPTERIPLQAYTVIASYAMWFIASLGVAIEVLVLLLPWSLGWVAKTDPELARTLFWFSGHAIVYFWLLPAYVSWYTMMPRQTGGRLYSDGLARLVFVMFLLLSIPTGLHHQYTDPGLRADIKVLHLILTFTIFIPSAITAFTLMAAFENAGRRRGGKGLFGWIFALPWGDPSVTAQFMAMFGFVLGGISGLVNASYNLNLVVHNTAWIPGHFHLTVGTAVALSIMGVCYWLVPYMTGRNLWGRRVALAQSWLWLGGVMVFSRGQIMGGLEGLPRREQVSALAYDQPAWQISHVLTGIGGSVMFISGVLFLVVMAMTLLVGLRGAQVTWPVAQAVEGPEASWPILDRWRLWIAASLALIVLAYGPVVLTYRANFVSPPDTGAYGWSRTP